MDFVVFIKKSQCQCIHTEFDLDPSQSQNANTVVSSKFKSLTGHLYCKTIEQIVHSFTHAYINFFILYNHKRQDLLHMFFVNVFPRIQIL